MNIQAYPLLQLMFSGSSSPKQVQLVLMHLYQTWCQLARSAIILFSSSNSNHTSSDSSGNMLLHSGTGERAVEALKEMDQQIIPWFQSAAGELLRDMPPEKALALALAKITGNTELKVGIPDIDTLCCTAPSDCSAVCESV